MKKKKICEEGIRDRWCDYCGEKILPDELHIKFTANVRGWTDNSNLCCLCIERAYKEVGRKLINKVKSRVFVKKL